jgi:phospholipid-binding lipoprotein MlaA|tara:strand:+ start:927 stop:1736 length:810 start_codon:yes stop_codon:yes gene_type:complete
MIRKFLCITIFALLLQANITYAGSVDEELKKSASTNTANECFEGFSRAMFKFNHALDGAIFKPVAKGYRALPSALRKGTGNAVDNLRSLLSLSNNILQGDLGGAGNTAARFAINTTVGILGVFDPAARLGFEEAGKEDFGQTLGVWGSSSGCYFVLPILGPTTTRDAIGLVANSFVDPVYQITHNTEISNGVIGNSNYSEHNYYYYRSTGAVDFRAKNIESFNSLEKNSIDLYASVKSLYLQSRNKKILNSTSTTETQNDSDWEEIDTN